MMRAPISFFAMPFLAIGLGACGGPEADGTTRPVCASGASNLSYEGELAGEPATAELEFAPVAHVELVGTLRAETGEWELRATFRDGIGYGHMIHVETHQAESIRIRFVEDGIELRASAGQWDRLVEAIDVGRADVDC